MGDGVGAVGDQAGDQRAEHECHGDGRLVFLLNADALEDLNSDGQHDKNGCRSGQHEVEHVVCGKEHDDGPPGALARELVGQKPDRNSTGGAAFC